MQYIEWKVAHLLNKPIESLCGYLTVLPGAFSGYRWAAIEVGQGAATLLQDGVQPHRAHDVLPWIVYHVQHTL